MYKGGKLGNQTKTGLIFEKKQSLLDVFTKSQNYDLLPVESNYWKLIYKNKKVGYFFIKHGLYKFLNNHKIDWKNHLSKKLLPDNAIFVLYQNTLNIIEIKYQEVEGSVDEKLQTCDFKKKQYKKLVANLNWNVEYIYLLNDWFKKPQYKDVLDYIISVNCSFYFNYLPLEKLGLKV